MPGGKINKHFGKDRHFLNKGGGKEGFVINI